jgi:hypothetical protein
MNELNIMLNGSDGDTLRLLATREAMTRFNIWGEVRWSRRKADLTLPSEAMLVESTQYESADYNDDGTMARIDAFVTTGFETVALVRLFEEAVALTVWGDSRESVDSTIAAYLEAWPPRRENEPDAESGPTAGHYL